MWHEGKGKGARRRAARWDGHQHLEGMTVSKNRVEATMATSRSNNGDDHGP